MNRRKLMMITAGSVAIGALTLHTPSNAGASSVVATWFVHGDGAGAGVAGSVSGILLADGVATGTGEIAIQTPTGRTTVQIRTVSWVPVSPTADGVLDVTSTGEEDCLVVGIGSGRPGPAGHTFTSNCFDPAVDIGTYGAVRPIG